MNELLLRRRMLLNKINNTNKTFALRSTGTQYINTGYIPNINTWVKVKFSMHQFSRYGPHILSCNNLYVPFYRTNNNGQVFYNYFGNEGDLGSIEYNLDTIYEVEAFKNNQIIINGDVFGNITAGTTFGNTSAMSIFTYNCDTTDVFMARMSLYYLQIYEGNTLVKDYIPEYGENSEPCLRERVSNILYYSHTNQPFFMDEI